MTGSEFHRWKAIIIAFGTIDGVLAADEAVAIYEPALDFQPTEARVAPSTVVESSHKTRLPAVPTDAGPAVEAVVTASSGQVAHFPLQVPRALSKLYPLAQVPTVHRRDVHTVQASRDPAINEEHARHVEPDVAEVTSKNPDEHKEMGGLDL